MDKNKFLILPFIAVMIIGIIFLSTQIPTAKVTPKHLPVALVNEDAGEMSQVIVDNLKKNAPEAVEFIEYDNVKSMKDKMADRDTYAGLVIPKDFSEGLASIQSENPQKAKMNVFINEGVNASVATSLETILQKVTTQISATVSQQMLAGIEQSTEKLTKEVEQQLAVVAKTLPNKEAGESLAKLSTMISPIQAEKVTILADPIETTVEKVNTTGDLGSAPTGLFMPLWMASIIGAAMLYLAGNKREFKTEKSRRTFQVIQSLMPIIYGLFSGYFVLWCSTWLLGFEFESFNKVALFASIGVIAFVYMILAFVSWFRLPVIALFVLFVFFGLPLIQLVPEMLPEFYTNYVLPWLPITFLVNGLKEVLFFSKDVINHYSIVLMGIAVGGFILLWIKNFVFRPYKALFK